jgi:serine/threonine-protein kinase
VNRGPGFLLVLASSFLALDAGTARGQNAADLAAADALFDQGKHLMEQGEYTDACPKLAASLRLDVGIGAMLYLAECYVHLGRTASAWARFREAAAIAASKRDPRAELARARAEQLESHLSRLVVAISTPNVPGMVMRRDGEQLDRAAWTTAVPVDPGVHVVEVSAPGKKTFTATITVERDVSTTTMTVPPLDASGPPLGPPPFAPLPPAEGLAGRAPPRRAGGRRVVALAAGGLGLLGAGLGTYWGLHARSLLEQSNSNGHCLGNICDGFGVAARANAQDQANLATVAFLVSGSFLGAGAILWLTVAHVPAGVALAPSLGPRQEGLVLVGTF